MIATLERLRERREAGEEGGFTLIELLIVIVILGILAAIVVFAVQNLTGQSATSACQANYKTVETAEEAYKAQVGSYTTAVSALQTHATGLDGSQVGPWLKDAPPAAGSSGPYYITLEAGGTVKVHTVKTNGAKTTASGASTGACSNA